MIEDAAARSLAHWSEHHRRGMEAFDARAQPDCEQLAGALDSNAFLASRQAAARAELHLLDGGASSTTPSRRPSCSRLPSSAPYLASAHDRAGDVYRFHQEVDCVLLVPGGGPVPWATA